MSVSVVVRRVLFGTGVLIVAACAVPPSAPPAPATPPAPAEQSAAPEPLPPPVPAPERPPAPRAPTAEERQRAEQLVAEAITQLQAGDAAGGRGLLEQALALDPNSELGRLMMRQVAADPVAELGAAHFTYTIQRDDTLARLAQRFLGDRHLFYLLARYNDIAQPNRIQVGQVIKVPGKAPPKAAEAAAVEPVRASPSPPAAAPLDDGTARRLALAREQERKGDLEAALQTYGDILSRDPANAEARQRAEAARRRLAERHYAEGSAAFARQDLDKAIASWDKVLQLDAEHQNARLKRQQALDLKERLRRFDSKK